MSRNVLRINITISEARVKSPILLFLLFINILAYVLLKKVIYIAQVSSMEFKVNDTQ